MPKDIQIKSKRMLWVRKFIAVGKSGEITSMIGKFILQHLLEALIFLILCVIQNIYMPHDKIKYD